jgi:glutathione S-transferase
MLRLHGAPIRSYYNKTKLASLEKGIQFEEVMTMPAMADRDEAFAAFMASKKGRVSTC